MFHLYKYSFFLMAFGIFTAIARNNSGREFLLAFGPNLASSSAPDVNRVFVATSTNITIVRIECPANNTNMSLSIPANTVQSFDFDRTATRMSTTTGVAKLGIRITSDQNIVVYGLNIRQASSDGFLGLPTSVQGARYLVGGYVSPVNNPSFVLVAAGPGGASIALKLRLQGGTIFFQSALYTTGSWINITLSSFDVFGLTLVGDDFTGTEVYSNDPISVFSGALCALVPAGVTSCDHLIEQMPPIDTLGTEYITVPLVNRTGGDVFRIVASKNGTTVRENGNSHSMNAGDYIDIIVPSTDYRVITGDKPFMVLQFSQGKTADGTQIDPFMSLLPPTAQFGASYLFSTPDPSVPYFTSYGALVVLTSKTSGLTLDGQTVTGSWTPVAGSLFSALTISFSSGQHFVYHSDPTVTFALYVYGYAAADSYGYTGGSRYAAIGTPCVPSNSVVADEIDNDCDGRIDEEFLNGIDDDGDGRIDEDVAVLPPTISSSTNMSLTACSANISTSSSGVPTHTFYSVCALTVSIPTHTDSTPSVTNCEEQIQRSWIATDGCGQQSNIVTQHIKAMYPALSISIPANVTSTCGSSTLPATTGSVTALSSCGSVLTTVSYSDTSQGSCPSGQVIYRTWIVAESCGRTQTVQQVINLLASSIGSTLTTTLRSSAAQTDVQVLLLLLLPALSWFC